MHGLQYLSKSKFFFIIAFDNVRGGGLSAPRAIQDCAK